MEVTDEEKKWCDHVGHQATCFDEWIVIRWKRDAPLWMKKKTREFLEKYGFSFSTDSSWYCHIPSRKCYTQMEAVIKGCPTIFFKIMYPTEIVNLCTSKKAQISARSLGLV